MAVKCYNQVEVILVFQGSGHYLSFHPPAFDMTDVAHYEVDPVSEDAVNMLASDSEDEEVMLPTRSSSPTMLSLNEATDIVVAEGLLPASSSSSSSSTLTMSREDKMLRGLEMCQKLFLRMVQSQSRTQDDVREIRGDVKTLNEKLKRLEQSNSHNVAVAKCDQLQLVLQFLVSYGMDTVHGFVMAFPMYVGNALCLIINVPLLHASLRAFWKEYCGKWKRKDVLLILRKLPVKELKMMADKVVYYLKFQQMFAVDHTQRTKNYDNFVVIEAEDFFKAYKTAVDLKGRNTITLPEKDLSKMREGLDGSAFKNVSNTHASTYDPERGDHGVLNGKMAWGFEVQREVLSQNSVGPFFKQMYVLAQQTEGVELYSTPVPAARWHQVSHFSGLSLLFAEPVRTREELFAEEESSSSSSGGSSESSEAEDDDGDSSVGEDETTVPVRRGKGPEFARPGFMPPRPGVPPATGSATSLATASATSSSARTPSQKRSRTMQSTSVFDRVQDDRAYKKSKKDKQ